MLETTTRFIGAGAAILLMSASAAFAQTPDEIVTADEPPPVLPTSGDGAEIIKLLENVCRPMIEEGRELEDLARSVGMRQDRRSATYVLPLAQRPYQLSMQPFSAANSDVCEIKVTYAPGWDQPIVDALNVWRFLHEPQLHRVRNDIGTYNDNVSRQTITWDNWSNQGFDGEMVGLVLVQLNKPDGSPTGSNFDEALVQYTVKPPLPEAVEQAEAFTAAQEAAAAAQAAAEAAAAQEQAQQPATPPATSAASDEPAPAEVPAL